MAKMCYYYILLIAYESLSQHWTCSLQTSISSKGALLKHVAGFDDENITERKRPSNTCLVFPLFLSSLIVI